MPKPADPIREMIVRTPDWRGKTLARLRRVIREADPEISEEVKWRRPSNPMGVPVWEHDGIVCVGNILKGSVRLTFFAGADLPDPRDLFNSRFNSKTVRAIDFSEDDPIEETALKALIRSGVQHNLKKKTAKPRTKRK